MHAGGVPAGGVRFGVSAAKSVGKRRVVEGVRSTAGVFTPSAQVVSSTGILVGERRAAVRRRMGKARDAPVRWCSLRESESGRMAWQNSRTLRACVPRVVDSLLLRRVVQPWHILRPTCTPCPPAVPDRQSDGDRCSLLIVCPTPSRKTLSAAVRRPDDHRQASAFEATCPVLRQILRAKGGPSLLSQNLLGKGELQ